MQDFEKLGAFYLGKSYDLAARKRRDDIVMYDSKDLVTHAVCVGMTGSGKTGLCIGLIEEAAIDGIPSIIIDPKGDLSNLLLTFPNLKPEDFRPWINPDDAAKKGLSPDDFAKAQAQTWTKGLGEWGQDGARIQRLKDAADVAIYTPGSNAGLPVSILKSFAAPEKAILDDSELLRDRVSTTATSLLGLLKIDADPIQSREHILLSTILLEAWSSSKDLDLAELISQIQRPPQANVGVMAMDAFFPQKDRFQFAMSLNNLIASPGFSAWMQGEAFDIAGALRTQQGKPRVSIFSIAHLSDSERMFFVSMLFNEILGWVRTQSGTTSLRALVYMDEIAGYFPPVANPPSKQPMLTLMKQARAFGVGMVFATQNPVDIDYKGLANAGTWFIGRLQTQRDKDRVLDGLEGAAAAASAKFDRASADKAMSALGQRVFLMNNVHEDEPVIFETRWCLSYLAGPLTRTQIKALMDPKRGPLDNPAGTTNRLGQMAERAASAIGLGKDGTSKSPPMIPNVVPYFLPIRSTKPAGAQLVYEPRLLGCAKVYYHDTKVGVDQEVPVALLATIADGAVAVEWENAQGVELAESDLDKDPAPGASFANLPGEASKPKSFDAWKKTLGEALFRTQKLELFQSPSLEATSKPNESERDFRARLAHSAKEERDRQVEALRVKYAPKIAALQERLQKAQAAKDAQSSQSTAAMIGTAVSVGAAILSAFMGRKAISATSVSKAATAMRSGSRAMKESGDVARAGETVEAVQAQVQALEDQLKSETDAIGARVDPTSETLDRVTLKPKKTNITVRSLVLAWAPSWVDGLGNATSAWE